MDPQETFQIIIRSLGDAKACETIDDHVTALLDWILAGGFEPEWVAGDLATSYVCCRIHYHERSSELQTLKKKLTRI